MRRLFRYSLVAVCLSLPAQAAIAQDSPATPVAGRQPQRPRGPRPNPTNIKVLPKNITGDDVVKVMHQYEGDLGVECSYCHVPRAPETKHSDFASDANPVKETARAMIRMTDDLNAKYLAQLSTRKTTDPITCGTCHQGMAHPAVFVPKKTNPPAGAMPAGTPAPSPPAL